MPGLSPEFAEAITGVSVFSFAASYFYGRIAMLKQEMAKLCHESTHDELTGLPNRRAFNHASVRFWATHQRHPDRRMSAIALDIDHFKQINDTEGHARGDEILQKVGSVIIERVRVPELPARTGGEEFAVLAETDLAGAEILAEEIRSKAKARAGVTISAGIAEFNSGPSMEAVLRNADMALYAAKNDGRDRVMAYLAPPSESENLLVPKLRF